MMKKLQAPDLGKGRYATEENKKQKNEGQSQTTESWHSAEGNRGIQNT